MEAFSLQYIIYTTIPIIFSLLEKIENNYLKYTYRKFYKQVTILIERLTNTPTSLENVLKHFLTKIVCSYWSKISSIDEIKVSSGMMNFIFDHFATVALKPASNLSLYYPYKCYPISNRFSSSILKAEFDTRLYINLSINYHSVNI